MGQKFLIAAIYRNDLGGKEVLRQTISFENLIIVFTFEGGHKCVSLVVYRPPRSSVALFLSELDELISDLRLISEDIIVCGDLNIHIDKTNDTNTVRLLQVLNGNNLEQHRTMR